MVKGILLSARLRTLPLSLAVIGVAHVLAGKMGFANWNISLLAALTASLLQILSNFANDYGDFVKGTDQAANRTDRALSSGALSLLQMKNILIFSSSLTLVVGVALLYFAFGSVWNWTFAGLFVVGLAAIAAALKYTLGKKPYGYKALGDAFVFVFFGPVAILGTLLLYNPQFASWPLNFGSVWAGIWCGLNAVLILTINNIRDLHKDKQVGKITIPVLLGPNKAEWYFHILSLASVLAFVAFRVHTDSFSLAPILLPIVHLFVFNLWLRKLSTNPSHQAYTQMLKIMSISFLLSPLFAWL